MSIQSVLFPRCSSGIGYFILRLSCQTNKVYLVPNRKMKLLVERGKGRASFPGYPQQMFPCFTFKECNVFEVFASAQLG